MEVAILTCANRSLCFGKLRARVSLGIAGTEQLSTCSASDQRDRGRVFLDLLSNLEWSGSSGYSR